MSAPNKVALDFTALLLDTFGYTDDEFVSLGYEDTDGVFHTAVMAPADATAAADKIPSTANAYFGVNPITGPARKNSGRGKEADVTRLAALPVDLDIKPGGCPNLDVAHAIIAELGIRLGCTRPAVVVETGHGLHAYWVISDGKVIDGDIGPARALLKRWGRLVTHVAGTHNVRVDNVFDLTRVMRLPGSHNNKSSSNGQGAPLVTAYADSGVPLTLAEVDARLTKAGVHERDDDRAASRETVSPPADWRWTETTCPYVAKMIDGWATDRPKNGARNPFVYNLHIRLACAHRFGCVTEADHTRGRQILADLLTELVHTTEPRREPRKFEIDDMIEYGTAKAASKTDEEVRAELGKHTHDDAQQQAQPKPQPAQPVPLSEALAVFAKWLHIADPAPVLAVAAAIIANTTPGEPVWLLIVGPPSGGKTEIIVTCLRLPYNVVSAAIITEAALLSGTAKRDRAKEATGGLLRQIGEFGILLAKDFTSVLAQNHDTAKAAMAALREIYDGRWDRPVGTDGGKTLHWHGKCGFIGGVTPSYDRYSTIVNTLGDRFLLLRLPEVDAAKQAHAALKAAQHEQQMRTELAKAMHGLIAAADRDQVTAALTEADHARLATLAVYAARARTAVERDGYTGELQVVPLPEGPARLVKELRQLYGALAAIGVDTGGRWNILSRIARDCAPAIRTTLIRVLVDDTDWRRTAEIATSACLVTKTAARHLDDLALLGLAERTKQSPKKRAADSDGDGAADNSPYYWRASGWLREHWPK